MYCNTRTSRKSEPIVFGDKIFKTQKQADIYVKELIYNIGICDSLKTYDGLAYQKLCDVLKRHPNANSKLADMVDLKIGRNTLNKNALEVHIIKTNGCSEDISWKICISGKDKSDKSELASAMRYSIEDQIMEYSIHHNHNICALCEEKTENTHVDHIIHFEKLMQDFISDTTHQIPKSFNDATDGSNRRAFRQEDSSFENEWKRYHKKHAELRICCVSCNCKRPKYKKTSDLPFY